PVVIKSVRSTRIACASGLLIGATAVSALAQNATSVPMSTAPAASSPAIGFLDVGSEKEQVLRVLQILGDVPLYPWSIRQLSPSEEDRFVPKSAAAAALLPRDPRVRTYGKLRMQVLPMEMQAIYNSAFPY